MKRGEVRYFLSAAPDKRRPVVVLTRDQAIRHLNEVTVAPITTTVRSIPVEVALDQSDGMSQRCVVNLDPLQTVPRHRLGEVIAELGAPRLDQIERSLLFALGFRDDVR